MSMERVVKFFETKPVQGVGPLFCRFTCSRAVLPKFDQHVEHVCDRDDPLVVQVRRAGSALVGFFASDSRCRWCLATGRSRHQRLKPSVNSSLSVSALNGSVPSCFLGSPRPSRSLS